MGIREKVKHGDLEPAVALALVYAGEVDGKGPPSPYIVRWLNRRINLGLTSEKVKELAEKAAEEQKKRLKSESAAKRKTRGKRSR